MQWNGAKPSVLVFDVNETLLDIEVLSPLFERVFGDRRVLREWFGQLVLYSMAVTLSGFYRDFFSLGQGLFEMLGAVHGAGVQAADLHALREALLTMPAHADVEEGLKTLKQSGFRMVTLTNSPPNPQGQSPLERAGLAAHFERQFTIAAARSFKPASVVYRMVAEELNVPRAACCMIAAHVWDTLGAQSAGFFAGLLTRPGNAPLLVPGLPQPHVVAPDLPTLAAQMIELWGSSR